MGAGQAPDRSGNELRELLTPYAEWDAHANGTAMATIAHLRQNNAGLVAQIRRIQASRSMRLTAPLRAAQAGLRKLKSRFVDNTTRL